MYKFQLSGFAESALPVDITGELSVEPTRIQVRFNLGGEIHLLSYPELKSDVARADELWKTTCFEVFMKLVDQAAYWEYNLSPSGDWNVYRFQAYRQQQQREASITHIDIDVKKSDHKLQTLTASLPLPPVLRDQPLCLGVSSVVEDKQGHKHFYALNHVAAKPDFHDHKSFTIVTG